MLDLTDIMEESIVVTEASNGQLEWNLAHKNAVSFKDSYNNTSELINGIAKAIKVDATIAYPLGMIQSTYGLKDRIDITGFAWYGKDIAKFSITARYGSNETMVKAKCNSINRISFKEGNDIETFKKVTRDLSSVSLLSITPAKDGIAITLYKPSKEICSKMESKYGTKTKLLNRTFKIPNK